MHPTFKASFRRRPESTSVAIRLGCAVGLTAVLATACGESPREPSAEPPLPVPDSGADAGPVVGIVPLVSTLPPLDPNADPRTPLGELRARFLPIWSPDLDWAFPPEICGSAWELDAIAEPAAAAVEVLADPVVAMALGVMRYEHLVSRAMAQPDELQQLCVAVATVGEARAGSLASLVTHLANGSGEPAAGYPDGVRLLAASPTEALGVTCTSPSGPAGGVWLRAYVVSVSRGLEDPVADVSYRVSDVTATRGESCRELDVWADQWSRRVQEWVDGGEIWAPIDQVITTAEICDRATGGDRSDCPRNWLQ